MNEIEIEKVSRAIARADLLEGKSPYTTWTDAELEALVHGCWDLHIKQAEAAIEAMMPRGEYMKVYVALDKRGTYRGSCTSDAENNLHHIIQFVVKHIMDGDQIRLLQEGHAEALKEEMLEHRASND